MVIDDREMIHYLFSCFARCFLAANVVAIPCYINDMSIADVKVFRARQA